MNAQTKVTNGNHNNTNVLYGKKSIPKLFS